MKKILRFVLVDDDLLALKLEEKLIQRFFEHTEIITFGSAGEVLEFIKREYILIKNIIPTILITDLHMPETDGLALLDSIEAMDGAVMRHLNAFVLSAAASANDIQRVLSNKNVKGFYSKPLTVGKIEEIIKYIEEHD